MPEISQIIGVQKLVNVVKNGKSAYHKDYKRVTELAHLYEILVTGENSKELLIRFNPREDKDQFEQRVRLTQLVTPAVCEKIMQPFYKVSRIDNVYKDVVLKSQDQDKEKIDRVLEGKKEFWGDESLDDYMETRYTELSFTDPNTFIIVEFNPFDSKTESAKPFPYEASSKEAVDFKYVNNVLQYLIIEKDILYQKGKKGEKEMVKGKHYRLYMSDFVVTLTQVDKDLKVEGVSIDIEDADFIEDAPNYVLVGKNVFKVVVGNPGSKEVQAVRVGYKRDISTKGRTYVSPMHAAVPRMKKTIKTISELDLTMTLHSFPQKLIYQKPCPGESSDICRSGTNSKGEKCKACKGSGFEVHKTTSDLIKVELPRDPKDMMKLDDLIAYKSPPVDLIKFQDEYVEKLEKKAVTDVFVSESMSMVTPTKTATEKDYDMESVYDTLFPFGNRFSSVWKKLCGLIAEFKDVEAIATHVFPKDYKLKTEKALIADLKAAKDADAPTFMVTEIENDIANKIYSDHPEKLKRYQVKQQHIPFSGKTPEEITISINMNLTTKEDRVLWSNFDSIITEIENEQIKERNNFYDLAYDKRVELISKKVEEYIERLEDDKSSSTLFPTKPEDDVPPIQDEGDDGDE